MERIHVSGERTNRHADARVPIAIRRLGQSLANFIGMRFGSCLKVSQGLTLRR